MKGNFEVCDGIVDLKLVDSTTGNQAPSFFLGSFDSTSKIITIKVETSERTSLGNHKVSIGFTLPS